MRYAMIAAVTLLAACSGAGASDSALADEPTRASAAATKRPVVVELYQSQGCSSCPPANANLNAIAGNANLIPLSFAVTYWDRLGWKDTFAKPQFTARQWDYAHAGNRKQVATPQMIVDGRIVINGGNRAAIDKAVAKAARSQAGPAITHSGNKVTVAKGSTAAPATVWLVRYDPRDQKVAIRSGENGGKTLPHRNIVRSLDSIGSWSGPSASFTVPAAANAAYRTAVFVQRGKGGPIVAAAKL